MDFTEFVILGGPILLIAMLIYAYAQRFLCDKKTERGIHWRGMVLKYSCWPVFTYAFYLTLINKKIPYLPTAKIAVSGFMNPFIKPLLLYCVIFLIMMIGIYIERRFYIPESELILTAEKTWAMIGFAMIAFLQFLGGIGAAYKSKYIKPENAWSKVIVKSDKRIIIKK